MRCQIARLHCQDFLEGRLNMTRTRDFQDHLASCPGCDAELTPWRELWTDLRGLAPSSATPNLEPFIAAALRGSLLGIPKGLIMLFALASLGTFSGMLLSSGDLASGRSLISACLWSVAGISAVCTIWCAVGYNCRPERIAAIQEE
jgi:anti-sigma factor RsiW